MIAPNFKRRLSGVTSTIIQLVPRQRALGLAIATLGPGLPDDLPRIRFRDLRRLWRRRAEGRPRVWHARRNVEMLPAIILRDVARMPLKIVFTSASQRQHTRWSRFLIARMDAVVATSRKTAAYLQRPATIVMHGIDTARFRPADEKSAAKKRLGLEPDKLHVGCFGRVRRQKGTDLFVDAMIALLPANPDWIGIIAGRTTAEHHGFEQGLRERIKAAGLSDRIRFVGEHTDIDAWYRGLDLFVAPQRWEGFGLTPLEAMATGVPVIAADVGAFSELILEAETGTVVPPDDLAAMIEATAPYMNDHLMRLERGRSGLEHVARSFPLEREAAALNAIYAELMGNP
ncbi:glycosyltransferase family 4 protein [Pararhizobium haloflavum]|uniref:glycosyltransferase family 4 protein n=1 Tax=Pararhizobium haloflavum TaxID=2037914 RepID=UPI001FDEF626|nr:glycosyltransferase family 4 protein [Pararhizobium haloflavum]